MSLTPDVEQIRLGFEIITVFRSQMQCYVAVCSDSWEKLAPNYKLM